MTEKDALDIAARIAEQEGWPWQEPVAAKKKKSLFGKACWVVRTNAAARGRNVYVVIDDRTQAIIRAAFWPR